MTPEKFIAVWANNKLTERGGAQTHFNDLCDLLEVDKPRDPDNYCFERGAKKSGGGDGWADVWKRGFFGWENKKPGRDLNLALKQLTDYALKLESPPLLVVSDRERIIIHTAFQNYPPQAHEIRIEELMDPARRQLLKWVFTDPEKLRPEKSTAAITQEAAGKFASIAKAIRDRGQDGQEVAHFLVQCLFCMFAEDEKLLPDMALTRLLQSAATDPERAANRLAVLFTTMRKGGDYGDLPIPWFNGGLFKTVKVPPLTQADLTALHRAAADMDWRAIDPTIFGTLFENGLDPAKRAQLGANYTDTATIAKIITPLVTEPLLAEWAAVKQVMAAEQGKGKKAAISKTALAAYQGFLLRLNNFRVLDPACGSGNFLYLALKALRDVEKLASVEARELGLGAELSMQTGPHNILGIEINEFAAELARVTVWIGDIQWCRRNGYPLATHPILKPLDSIEHRDALMNPDGSEAAWPEAEAIVGNPPFLGDRKMIRELGEDYTVKLRRLYEGRVPGGADLVTYWFEKARAQLEAGKCQRAGLVATNSLRGGANQKVMSRICETSRIFNAWSDEPWVNEGAAVRVSLVCFGHAEGTLLDDKPVATIHADLTAGDGLNLTLAKPLKVNTGASFIGTQKNGPFDVSGEVARQWLKLPNPNGKSNSEVVRPWANGLDVTRRPQDRWVVDFGCDMQLHEAVEFETPFAHVQQQVKPTRADVRRDRHRTHWWLYGDARPGLRERLTKVLRYVVTPMVAKHRVFAWMPAVQIPENLCVAITRADDTTFGLLHSRFHELWSLRMGTSLEDRPRYTPTTCFETFPFPAGLSPADTAHQRTEAVEGGALIPADISADLIQNEPLAQSGRAQSAIKGIAIREHATRIACAAKRLNDLRENYLNPALWVDWVITPEEAAAGYPRRPVAKPGFEAEVKKLTLTNLYNASPAWLTMAHEALDQAVAAAYGWTDYTPEMGEDEILRRLLALNLAILPVAPAGDEAEKPKKKMPLAQD